MKTITFLLLGLGNGAVFAALGVTIALAFRTSNVVNFGAGSMALFGAVTFQSLRTKASFFNPISMATPLLIALAVFAAVGFAVNAVKRGRLTPKYCAGVGAGFAALVALALQPPFINIGTNLGLAGALLVTIVISALFGWAVYAAVFAKLLYTFPLPRVAAAIGLLVVMPALVTNRMPGGATIEAPGVFPGSVWHLGELVIQSNHVWMAAAVVAIAIGLTILYNKSKFGLQTTATAETTVGATILGVSPKFVGGMNWVIAGAVAGLFGALIVSLVPTDPSDFTLFVIAALAAAMLGGMSSVWWIALSGLAIGMLQSEVQYLVDRYRFLPQQGFTDLVPLVLLVGVMLFRGKTLPERGALIRRSLPAARSPRHVTQWTVVMTVVALVLSLTLHGGYLVALVATLIGALLAFSLVVLLGFVGQISLAQYMFAGISAFLLSRLTIDWGVPFPFAPLIAALIAGAVGSIMAIPALRVRGVNLAILTLTAGVAVEDIYFSSPRYVGAGGSPTVKSPSLFGLQLGIGTHGHYPRVEFPIMVTLVVLVIGLLVVGLRRSSLGLQMLAVRANERAAAANGINVARVKILAFAVSSFIAGVAGACMAYFNYGGFSSISFDALLSVTLVASVLIAGSTTVSGAVIAGLGFAGGIIAVLIQKAVPTFPAWYEVFAGIGLMIAAVSLPEGIAGRFAEHGAWLSATFERLRARRTPPEPRVSDDGTTVAVGVAVAAGGAAEPPASVSTTPAREGRHS